MPATADLRYAFNRGEIGKISLGRVDKDGLRLAAETQENWMPLPQGPMMARPGSAYLGTTRNNGVAKLIKFIFSRTDTALLELTNNFLRVWIDDALLTRVDVTGSNINNGTFSSTAGWNLLATDGATSTITGGTLNLTAGARGSKASASQTVQIPSANKNKVHALRIVIDRGPVFVKVGSTPDLDDLVKRTELGAGTHSLAFAPTTAFTVTFENTDRPLRIVHSCTMEAAGVVEVPTIWTSTDFDSLQYIPSGDVIFVACDGKKQQKIERRPNGSWSVVDYVAAKGPLREQKAREKDILLRSTAYEGNGTLVSSEPLFTADHIGAVFRVFPKGQRRRAAIAAEDTWTDPIRIAGVTFDRVFNTQITGTWSGTLNTQYSLTGPDVGFVQASASIGGGAVGVTKNGVYQMNDSKDNANVVIWYRVGFDVGDYKSGTAIIQFAGTPSAGGADVGIEANKAGGTAGYARVLSIVSSTVANVEITGAFGSLDKTKDWLIGEWNGDDGYPTATTLFDGRLWWAHKDRIWGSVSDDYENFDFDFQGDAGPISRSLGTGPVDSIAWLAPLTRLLVGRGTAVSAIRSSNFDDPLTPTNFTIKDTSTRGVLSTMPGQVDSRGIYIHANGLQLFEALYRVDVQDYTSQDLTQFNLDIGLAGLTSLAVAHSPDTRVFCIRADGQMPVLLRESDGDASLASWWRCRRSLGSYRDVAVLPGDIEDKVYVVVQFGSSRFVEVFARRDECVGAPLNKVLDSHIVYSGVATRTITGLTHLAGKTVKAWGAANATDTNGRDLGSYVVTAGGHIGLLPISVTTAVVGLPYTATFKSAKLAYGAGLSIGAIKRIDEISFVLFDTHAQSLFFGQDATSLEPMPLVEDGSDVDSDYVWSQYDKRMTSLPGRWDADSRLMLVSVPGRPVTVGAVLLSVDTSARQN